MKKIKPLDQISDNEIEEQIKLREAEYKIEYNGYLYGASNTYHKHYRNAQALKIEIKKLKDRL